MFSYTRAHHQSSPKSNLEHTQLSVREKKRETLKEKGRKVGLGGGWWWWWGGRGDTKKGGCRFQISEACVSENPYLSHI